MKRIFFAVLICAATCVFAGSTKRIDGAASGKFYNDVWKKWVDKELYIYVSDDGDTYITGGDGLIKATSYVNEEERKKLVELLQKGVQWAEKAKTEQAEITKELGSFSKKQKYFSSGIELTFFSANKGKQTDVIIDLKDFSNQFGKIKLYVSPDEVKKFIALLEKAPGTFQLLKEDEKKSEAFK